MEQRRVLTLREVAAFLRVHPNTVYRLAKRGRIPAFKVGSDWRFNLESIDSWRLAQERQSHEQIPRAGLASEILDILYWYQSEGLQTAVSVEDIRLFLDCDPQPIRRVLGELGSAGLVETPDPERFHLTPSGMAEWHRAVHRFAARPAGHAAVLVEPEIGKENCTWMR